MRLLEANFSRRIDLPGVGPAPRPVDIDQSVTGFVDLVSLRIYSFAVGAPIDGEAEGDEVAIIVLTGSCMIAVTGASAATFTLGDGAGPRAIYLPPEHHYRLTPLTPVDVAYCRARGRDARLPRAFDAVEGTGELLEDAGYFEKLEFSLRHAGPEEQVRVATAAGDAGERLVHVQSSAMAVIAAGRIKGTLGRWGSAALERGEAAEIIAGDDSLVLIVATR
ncbi:MAG: hypothetical protein JWR75_18 [Devosia sp.]|nr:hypothetical protein [Devosia sp.]